jgi:hypothetical protein
MSRGIVASPLDLNEPVDPNDPFPYGWLKKCCRAGMVRKAGK